MTAKDRAIYGAVPRTKTSRSISLTDRVTPDVVVVTRGDVEVICCHGARIFDQAPKVSHSLTDRARGFK
jgi:hypothetical protein